MRTGWAGADRSALHAPTLSPLTWARTRAPIWRTHAAADADLGHRRRPPPGRTVRRRACARPRTRPAEVALAVVAGERDGADVLHGHLAERDAHGGTGCVPLGGRRVTGGHTGWFVTVDGPSGVGKSTTVRALHEHLRAQGRTARRTAEPTGTALGLFTRGHANEVHGLALACLMAATRYEHIDRVIEPALRAGELVVSEHYLPSALLLQRLDGVSLDFLTDVSRHVLMPDLAVILTAEPGDIAARIAGRGVTHRLRLDPAAPAREIGLYADAASCLVRRGVQVLLLDTTDATPSDVARRIADAIPALPPASDTPAPTRPQDP
ncbi:hypothetical protein GTU99_01795 [Streptomyces sp. PRKS01-65]|nr:hypothetical protein [Streptomyces harenosi]